MARELDRRKLTPELIESFRSSARWMLRCVEAKQPKQEPEFQI